MTTQTFIAGSAAADITPQNSQFLQGYPHVRRYSTGVHDRLYSSVLYLSDGANQAMIIANDVATLSKAVVQQVRQTIAAATGIPEGCIMITATHTHSGPLTLYRYACRADECIPPVDDTYIQYLIDRMAAAAVDAFKAAQPARLGLAIADGTGVGTNRHDPAGPHDVEVPVLAVQSGDGQRCLSCLMICSMHPTVLHEDSTLISGDFPGMARQYLQKERLGPDCSVLYLMGPSGNQSPRHAVRANTFAEAERLGKILADAVIKVLPTIEYRSDLSLRSLQDFISLPPRKMMDIGSARQRLETAREKYNRLCRNLNSAPTIRTAECDVFGAEQNLVLSEAQEKGALKDVYDACLPAEIQIIRIGDWNLVGWAGEFFVEYALHIKEQVPNTYIASNTNGELQGYIVTPEAEQKGGYEASLGLFGSECGRIFIDKTLSMLKNI